MLAASAAACCMPFDISLVTVLCSSTATLQHGIQNLLKHFVPDVVEVRPM